VNRDIDC